MFIKRKQASDVSDCPLSWLTVADMTENNKKLQQQIDELLNRYNNQRDYEEE